jgi:predicted permease
MAVGYVCRRKGLFSDAFVKGAVNLLLLVVTPCLIVHVFQRPFSKELLTNLGMALAAAFFAHAVGLAFAETCFRRTDEMRKGVLKFGTVFSNGGFMAIPLEYALLGAEGAFYGAVYVVVFNLLCWTYGLKVMCGHLKDLDKRILFVNPGTIGLTVGLPLFLTSTTLPQVIGEPIRYLSELNTPLAMIIIGYYLADARFAAYFRCAPALVASGLRLLVIPSIVLAVLMMVRRFGLDPVMAVALTASASAPVAAMDSMFAAKYGKDVDLSVGLVSVTTLISIVTMPLIVGIAMSIF